MTIFHLITQYFLVGYVFFALYMCRSYSKMLEKSRQRFVEAWETADKYKKMYEDEKKKNERL